MFCCNDRSLIQQLYPGHLASAAARQIVYEGDTVPVLLQLRPNITTTITQIPVRGEHSTEQGDVTEFRG